MNHRLTLAAVALLSCARPYPPPGGEVDRLPPEIVATVPEPLAVVPGFDEPVEFRFDERISERGVGDASVLVSPATGDVTLDRGRSSLRVRLAGGWQPNTVYRVVLLPGIRDLFGNERREPVELVFSTGAELTDATVAGFITDRITGQAPSNVMVEAMLRPDSVRYVTVADSVAFFALTHLPLGTYDVRAWVDANANRRLEPSEPLARSMVVTLGTPADTFPVELSVIPQDTTPARLIAANPRDSVTVILGFDDYIEPDASVGATNTTLLELPDSTPVPATLALVHPVLHEARQRAAASDTTAADTAAADPVRADTTRQAAAGIGRTPAAGLGRQAAAPADTLALLPTREIVLISDRPLTPGTRYRLTLGPILNVSLLYGGGGTVEFEMPAPAPPPAARDTGNAWPTPGARSRP